MFAKQCLKIIFLQSAAYTLQTLLVSPKQVSKQYFSNGFQYTTETISKTMFGKLLLVLFHKLNADTLHYGHISALGSQYNAWHKWIN